MMFRLTKHFTVGGVPYFAGVMITMSTLDKVLDDGRLVYHFDDKFEVIPADVYKIVYSSLAEMEKNKDKK